MVFCQVMLCNPTVSYTDSWSSLVDEGDIQTTSCRQPKLVVAADDKGRPCWKMFKVLRAAGSDRSWSIVSRQGYHPSSNL